MNSPLIISYVSGKGGVGKTTLAVAMAKELARKNSTLLIDLDFFNRGLTGLMPDGVFVDVVNKPGFFPNKTNEAQEEQWEIRCVDENIYYINFPDLEPNDLRSLESIEVNELKKSLGKFVHDAALKSGCSCIVLDCHGGPDNSSFAACLISDHSIMVSEPDKITFYGTLNFMRQMEWVSDKSDINLHLIFNKVIPDFSAFFLRSFYNKSIRKHFGDRPLLGIYPLEIYLTKEFEKTPFLTEVYPGSLLARKTKVLLGDLLKPEHIDKLPKDIRSIPRPVAYFRKLSLGKPYTLLNLNFILPAIAIGLTIVVLFSLATENFADDYNEVFKREAITQIYQDDKDIQKYFPAVNQYVDGEINSQQFSDLIYENYYRNDQETASDEKAQYFTRLDNILYYHSHYRLLDSTDIQISSIKVPGVIKVRLFIIDYGETLSIAAVVWFIIALLFSWSKKLDRQFTYYYYKGNFLKSSILYITAFLLWFFPLTVTGSILFESQGFNLIEETFFVIVLLLLLVIILNQVLRIYRGLRYDYKTPIHLLQFIFLIYFCMAFLFGASFFEMLI